MGADRQGEATEHGILQGVVVVIAAAAGLDEGKAGVQRSGSPVGGADFEEDGLSAALARQFEKTAKQSGGQAATTEAWIDDKVFDFPLGADLPGDEEPAGRFLFNHQGQARRAGGEEKLIFGFGPMGGGSGLGLESAHGGDVTRDGRVDVHSRLAQRR